MSFDFWTAYWTFTAFVFGAIVGSFLNVCVWRLPRNESLSDPPSHCPACNHRLAFFPDMVPLLSQLWYRSRCRHCGTHFSWRYFWVELFTATTFAALYLRYVVYSPVVNLGEAERTWSAICAMIFAAALITIFFIDLEHYEIPDIAVIVAVGAAVAKDAILIWKGERPLWFPVPGTSVEVPLPLSILAGFMALWLLWQFAALCTALLGREAMGAGDSLLLGAMGAFLIPWPLAVLAFMIAIFLGAVGGVLGIWLANHTAAVAVPGLPTGSPADASLPEGHPETGVLAAAGRDFQEEVPASVSEDSQAGERVPAPAGADSRGMPHETAPETAGILDRSHRGTVPLGDDPGEIDPAGATDSDAGEPDVPALPSDSRWGRLWTVLGTWVAVAALWGGMYLSGDSVLLGLGAGVVGGLAAAALLAFGIRQWVRGDQEWLPAMDELFEEGDPGPRFIPFGPYLVAGTLIAMLIGRPLIEFYVSNVMMLPPSILAGLNWD